MKNIVKIISIVLAVTMIFVVLVSCNDNQTTQNQTTLGTETIQTTKATEQQTTNIQTDSTTSTTKVDDPITVEPFYSDNTVEKIGTYVNLSYNPDYCTVIAKVEEGLGDSEVVKLTVAMKDGYIFDGFTIGDYLPNLEDAKPGDEKSLISKDSVCAFGVDKETNVYLNYSMTLVYHANGGKLVNGEGDTFTTTYPLSYFKCPVTQKYGTFTREGYVLSEYGFNENGTGDRVSLGSRFKPESSTAHLYCIWEKASEQSNFEFKKGGSGIEITAYKGNEANVVIPESLDGSNVVSIAGYAFDNDNITRIFIPATVKKIAANAFYSKNLKEVVLHDSIVDMKDNAFEGCDNFTTVRINTVLDYFNEWCRGTYNKVDRLLWAKDLKKIVIYGGSGSWYGWDSELLTKEFGDEYVIVNLGMNANMSSCAFVDGISEYLNEGDIFLWAPEPGGNVLGAPDYDGGARTWWFTGSHFDLYKTIDISKYKNIFSTFSSYNMQHIQKPLNTSKSVINETIYGDMLAKENKMTAATYRFNYFGSWYDYSTMSSHISALKEKGVKVLFTYPAMAEEGINGDFSGVEEYKKNILANFDVEIISNYENLVFPIKYFHDSEWHMIHDGATLRTEQVVKDLKAYLGK